MNNKKPFLYAFVAAGYIVFIVSAISVVAPIVETLNETIVMPMAGLGLFVLSAAIMGFLFLSEPLRLFLENQKREAVTFFMKTIGFFAGFVALFVILIFLL